MDQNTIEELIHELTILSLVVLQNDDQHMAVLKPIGLVGNAIEAWKDSPAIRHRAKGKRKADLYYSDCPMVNIYYSKNKFGMKELFKVEQWEWAPGPGPGDFLKGFNTVSETVEFIRNYFFEENDLFLKRKNFEEQRNRG
jgi:hypothetical protein